MGDSGVSSAAKFLSDYLHWHCPQAVIVISSESAELLHGGCILFMRERDEHKRLQK